MRAEEFTQQASLEDPERLINLLGQIEGERWVREQLTKITPLTVRYSATIYRQAKEYQKEMPDSTIRELMYDLDSDSVVIYGAGGYNRYSVGDNGLVYPIDESFPNKEKLQLAKQLLSGSKQMKITEIGKIPDNVFTQSDVKSLFNALRLYKNLLKKLPGNNSYYYSFDNKNMVIWNDKFKPIAALSIHRADQDFYSFPVKNSYAVNWIGVLKSYQGQNLAKSLYGLVLLPPPVGLGGTLVSDESQTSGGRRNWASLARIPGVEVTGYVSFSIKYPNMKLIDDLLGRVGGVYLGENKYHIYYQFPITVDNNEVRNLIKNSKIKVYGDSEDSTNVGLIARYLG